MNTPNEPNKAANQLTDRTDNSLTKQNKKTRPSPNWLRRLVRCIGKKPKPTCSFCGGLGYKRYYCDFYGWTRMACNCSKKESAAIVRLEHNNNRRTK